MLLPEGFKVVELAPGVLTFDEVERENRRFDSATRVA